ncbi:MAG: hypothetical protein PHX44_04980 [Sulfurimonas sp.]|uniref:hypothetical protein n=1 Tax=Sulfurimonas sp. TaxID=2022749 RepID=UPI002631E8F2|nr:hypothetical protein [Sulfurimonas sp.]MDD2652389.1 hypothetical protein [Sulfurimonas sp.]MDD3451135.1 hypothetical protein [Sulfurimonas sp.]
MKKGFLLAFVLFFIGCDGKIYTNIHNKNKIGANFSSIEIVANDTFSKESVQTIMQKMGFLVAKSPYRLRAEHRNYKKACTNPLSKTSSDYSFDGLVSIELFYEQEKIYTAYMDYKGEQKEALFAKLINVMMDDLEISKP